MIKFLKNSWFFVLCLILNIVYTILGEFQRALEIIAFYFFIEIGFLIVLIKSVIKTKIDVSIEK